MNWTLLQNSCLVAGLTTFFCLTLGFLCALGLATLQASWRRGLLVVATLALVLPPFLVTNCWLDLLGQTGRWRGWLPLNIYSLGGTVWILTLLHWPITVLLVWSAWHRLESTFLEQEPALCGAALIRWLLWPMANRALALAGVLTLVLTLNHFAVPALLQVRVLPASMWVQFSTTFQYTEALRIGWPLWAGPILLLVVWKYGAIAWPSLEGRLSPNLLRQQLGPVWTGTGLILLGLFILLSVGLPLMQLILNHRTWLELGSVVRTAWAPAWTSFGLAWFTVLLSLAIALLTWRWRWGYVYWLPFLLPGIWLGIGMIQALKLPILQMLRQSSGVIVAAWTVRFLAPGWLAVRHAMQSTDPDLSDAARLSGIPAWRLLRDVVWPQIGLPTMAAGYLIYLFCLWDVETLVLIVPPGGETLALRIFNLLHYGHNAQVNALCLVLLGLALAPPALWLAGRWLRRLVRAHGYG